MTFRTFKLIFYLICTKSFLSFAQSPCKDSLIQKLFTDSLRIYRLKKILPYFSIDDRITRIANTRSDLSGFKIGVNLNEKYVFGLGIYSLLTIDNKISLNPKKDSTEFHLKMNYITLFYHHVIFKKNHIVFQIPFELGLGNVSFKKINLLKNKVIEENSYQVISSGFGLKSIIKPIPHLGFFIFLGYRWVKSKKTIPVNLNGGFSSIGLYINLLKINRDVRYYWIKKNKFKKNLKKCGI